MSKRGDVGYPLGGFGDAVYSEPYPIGSQAQLFVQGSLLTPSRRAELKAKLKTGELEELVFRAVVFRDGPNSNHTRFRASDLAAFAGSFVEMPFLRNHNVNDVGARDGIILASSLVGAEFQQTIRLTTERGMRDFLEGVIDRFSIGWYFEGVECSVCGHDWMECNHWPGQKYPTPGQGGEQMCELIFVGPRGKETSAVNAPAVQGTRIIEQLCILKESSMPEKTIVLPDGSLKVVAPAHTQLGEDTAAMVRAFRAEMDALRVEQLIRSSGLSQEGQEVVMTAAQGKDAAAAAHLIETQRKAEGARLSAQIVRGIRPVITENSMTTPQDRVQSALNWVFGVRQEPLPVPTMRSIRELYHAITGDYEWRGAFNPEWSQLATASTTTLAGMVVNAFNKAVQMHYENMATYRWYERIVDVAPHDGSTHDVQLIMVDGLANLPTVTEGAAYTEATVGDSKESLSFTKYGHYVGITLETIRRSDIQRIQAIPRAMVQASVRTRSAAIASIFTTASGAGPTLAEDSTALFHNNHGNLGTAAFDTAGWAAARTRIWEQQIPGTSKPLGLWPTFVLVPIELYDDALSEFGYGSGDVGKPSTAGTAQTVNPYGESRLGDPRPVPIPVPEWTDATDWAYMVDPRLHPVIHMAYANAPQGGQHPMPEIYEVTSESSGLMFTNDTLPVKVRDWWGYGIATYTGIGKNNVTD
ncbi:MAG: hypothetical protein IT328_13130 [Caldilineaceae bacterium]|nr:hypothetical protein [Caldilineaceae bacterium]